jgi:hypothetical protein
MPKVTIPRIADTAGRKLDVKVHGIAVASFLPLQVT